MKSILPFLLVASVALNVAFLTGCVSLHNAVFGNPCRISQGPATRPSSDNGRLELERIARLLSIRTNGKSTSDIAADIRYVLDRNADVPAQFDSSAFEKMAKDLNTDEEKAMREYQRFISNLQGKRVIAFEPEDR